MSSGDGSNPMVIDPMKTLPQTQYAEATPWALPYLSAHTTENDCADVLKHVNCSYLSTPGMPPTLAALKAHAHSLTVLISQLAPSSGPGEIDNVNIKKIKSSDPAAKSFKKLEAYDWLNDLSQPYTTDDPDHHRALNSLVNLTKSNSDTEGIQFHCPLELHPIPAAPKNMSAAAAAQYAADFGTQPYARHMNLLMHANECLEMLDHEFSTTGGLMSILPNEKGAEADQFKDVKTTLVGQWLLFTQHLVNRMHDLEIELANARDVLDGEAIIPMQHMSTHGPDARGGREIVYPQDKWILANAGDDVLEYLHRSLDNKERRATSKVTTYRAQGVTGHVLQAVDGQERGIVSLDVMTRFYRLTGDDNRGTIFILPAYADRPSTKGTRDLEERPTVVVMSETNFPTRVSEFKKRHDELQKQIDDLTRENFGHVQDINVRTQKQKELDDEVTTLRQTVDAYKNNLTDPEKLNQAKIDDYLDQIRKAKDALAAEQARSKGFKDQLDQLASNSLSYDNMKGSLPRDIEGNITNQAMKAVMETAKRISAENDQLKLEINRLQSSQMIIT